MRVMQEHAQPAFNVENGMHAVVWADALASDTRVMNLHGIRAFHSFDL